MLLQVGPLSVEFEEGMLRNIRLGPTLILQRIYCALRDQNWSTIPGTIRILHDERRDDETRIVFESAHQHNDIDFVWTGTISLTASELSFAMDGLARSTFKRNRIGFCVLHDADVAGQPCEIEHTDGTISSGHFPQEIAPHQPYPNLRAVRHTAGQAGVTVRMEGDTFEMEDQRNWSDASYKTYCTVLALPFPVLVAAGTEIHQKITLTVSNASVDAAPVPHLMICTAEGTSPLPALGLCLAHEAVPFGTTQREALRALHLGHLRIDLGPASSDFAARFAYAARMSRELETPLEIALWLNDTDKDLKVFQEIFRHTPLHVARWLVFHRREMVTSDSTIEQARPILESLNEADIYSGTDALFTQINRNPRTPAVFDGLTYSNNPQVHAFDNRSLIEAVEIHGVQVENAQRLSAGKSIAVSPITLKMRSNPDATAPVETPAGELPPHIDLRQMSLFAAVWTLGSIKYQAQAGAASLTYFTTHGLDGLMDAEGGSPLPNKFPTVGGMYPLYWVFHELAGLKDAMIRTMQSSHPRLVDALVIEHATGRCVFLVNNTSEAQTVMVRNIAGVYQRRELSLETLTPPNDFATQEPAPLRVEEAATFTLPAYGIVILRRG